MTRLRFNHAEAVAMVRDQCRLLSDVAAHFGVSRERIRQICAEAGVESPRSRKATAAMLDRGLQEVKGGATLAAASRASGTSTSHLSLQIKASGSSALHLRAQRQLQAYSSQLDQIRAGASIRSVAKGDLRLERRLQRLIKRTAAAPVLHGRWRDYEHRRKIIADGRRAGQTWKAIAVAITAAEGIPCSLQSASNYSYNHHII